MTTEPRQEAERIVTSYDNVVGSANYRARVAVRDPLVDALAAAIEVSRANPVPRSVPLYRLNVALSALREDET